jgi:hypothetical protein
LKLNVTDVNWFRWFTDCGPTVSSQVATADSGTSCPPAPRTYSRDRSSGCLRTSSLVSRITWYWSSAFLIR